MAKPKDPGPARRQFPGTGGSSIRDKRTGALTPNPLPADAPAEPEKDT